MKRVLAAVVAVGTAAVPTTANATAPPGTEGTITVFAAASLTESFTAIGEAFAADSGTGVEFNFAASSDLVASILEGNPADVFASADTRNMDKLVEAEANGGEPQVFATNILAIIVEAGNPQGITGVADLANPDLIVVSTSPDVPVGAYTHEVLANAGVEVEFDSEEENVRAVAEKVVLGEADAGIVYATDVTAAGDDAEGVEIPADINVIAEYPLAATADAENAAGAAAFVDFVLSDAGQEILAGYGFGPPDAATPDTTAASSPQTAPASTG
jgi:molybdate transport system substrate-binding protein